MVIQAKKSGYRRSSLRACSVLAAVIMLGACSSPKAAAPKKKPTPNAFESLQARTPESSEAKAAPRWEEVAVLTGTGPATRPLAISPDAIQWRADWNCQSGRLRLTTEPPPRSGGPIAEEACPASGKAYSVKTGSVRLNVAGEGAWRVVVSQQVTTPVDEAPLPEMSDPAARLVSRGDFFDVERKGKGRALLYRLGDSSLALRLEDFETSANTDLFVWVSDAARPATSKEALDSVHTEVAGLTSTKGSQNYRLPAGTDVGKVRSVVIWCRPVQIAYTAAALQSSPS